MATTTRRTVTIVLVLCLNAWVWFLALFILNNRYFSIERPEGEPFQTFPYGELRVGVDASFPPFAVDDQGQFYGADIDLALALGGEIGLPVRFVNLGYDGIYDALFTDQVDVLISALLVNPGRMDKVRYTRSYFNNGLVFISPANNSIQDMAQLPQKRVAYEFGSDADGLIRQWERRIASFALMPYELPTYALDAVRLGQADVALVDATTYRLYLRDHPNWQTTFAYQSDNLFAMAVRIDRADAWQRLDNALEKLMEQGKVAEILRKWL